MQSDTINGNKIIFTVFLKKYYILLQLAYGTAEISNPHSRSHVKCYACSAALIVSMSQIVARCRRKRCRQKWSKQTL